MGRKPKIETETGEKIIDEVEEKVKEKTEDEIVGQVDGETMETNFGLPSKELFRIDEVARYFDVHERTIRLWIDHGHLQAEKLAGSIRIPRTSIIKFRLVGRQQSIVM